MNYWVLLFCLKGLNSILSENRWFGAACVTVDGFVLWQSVIDCLYWKCTTNKGRFSNRFEQFKATISLFSFLMWCINELRVPWELDHILLLFNKLVDCNRCAWKNPSHMYSQPTLNATQVSLLLDVQIIRKNGLHRWCQDIWFCMKIMELILKLSTKCYEKKIIWKIF